MPRRKAPETRRASEEETQKSKKGSEQKRRGAMLRREEVTRSFPAWLPPSQKVGDTQEPERELFSESVAPPSPGFHKHTFPPGFFHISPHVLGGQALPPTPPQLGRSEQGELGILTGNAVLHR